MSTNRLHRCFVAAVAGLMISACDPEAGPGVESSTQAAGVPERGAGGGMLYCYHPIPPAALDIPATIIEMEVDRPYKAARPGFIREWAPGGLTPQGVFGELIIETDT